jgi:hypothetical protein
MGKFYPILNPMCVIIKRMGIKFKNLLTPIDWLYFLVRNYYKDL